MAPDPHPAEIVLERLLEYFQRKQKKAQDYYSNAHARGSNYSDGQRAASSWGLHETNVFMSIVENEISCMKRGMARPPEDQWCKWCGGAKGNHMSGCKKPQKEEPELPETHDEDCVGSHCSRCGSCDGGMCICYAR